MNAVYTAVRKHGTTRQLASAIVVCVACALLLLPAIVWFNLRFSVEQASLSVAEIETMLVYVALFGWGIPLGTTATYYLFTEPRLSSTSVRIPAQKRSTLENTTTPQPPRYKPGVVAPFVYGEDTPWGWLEYRSGRFQGQQLALLRAIVTIGRDEDNDIWLDDDMASRRHAELAWVRGQVYITDCDSLNGVLVAGRRIRGSVLIASNELLEIGSHRFVFLLAENTPEPLSEQSDPLINHTWRTSMEPLTAGSNLLPATRSLQPDQQAPKEIAGAGSSTPAAERVYQETAQVSAVTSVPLPSEVGGAIIIQEGALTGQCFLLDRPVISVGRSIGCDVTLDDVSISHLHAQFLRQASGNYVQDLGSRNGTRVNDELLTGPRLLKEGDIICIGTIRMQYVSVQSSRTVPLSHIITPRPFIPTTTGPLPLRLPSKRKE